MPASREAEPACNEVRLLGSRSWQVTGPGSVLQSGWPFSLDAGRAFVGGTRADAKAFGDFVDRQAVFEDAADHVHSTQAGRSFLWPSGVRVAATTFTLSDAMSNLLGSHD